MSNSNEAKDASITQNIGMDQPEERQSRGDDKKKLQDEIALKLKQKKLARKRGSNGTRSNISVVSTKTRLKTLQFFQKQEEKQKLRTEELLNQLGLVENTDGPVEEVAPATPGFKMQSEPQAVATINTLAAPEVEEAEEDDMDLQDDNDATSIIIPQEDPLEEGLPAEEHNHDSLSLQTGDSGSNGFEIENDSGSRSTESNESELPAVESESSLEFNHSSDSSANLDLTFSDPSGPIELPTEDQTRKANVADLTSSLGLGLEISTQFASELKLNAKHPDCYFCQMEKTSLGQFILEQTEFFSVFHHNAPMQAGHLLITPRGHYQKIEDLPSEVFSQMMAKTKEWHEHLKIKIAGLPGVAIFLSDTLTTNLGDAKHVAVNLIPRFPGDQFGIVLGNPKSPKPSAAQILKACERLKLT